MQYIYQMTTTATITKWSALNIPGTQYYTCVCVYICSKWQTCTHFKLNSKIFWHYGHLKPDQKQKHQRQQKPSNNNNNNKMKLKSPKIVFAQM